MSAYKYSCPYCGQHIEYTDGYCGQQMACPMCQQNIVFPALPPGALKTSLRIARPAQQAAKQGWSFNPGRMFAALRGFEHWNVVGQCLIPFFILGGALFVASQPRSKPVEQTASAPVAAVNPSTWEKMTELAKVEETVKQRLQAVTIAYAQDARARRDRDVLEKGYGSKLSEASRNRQDAICAATSSALSAARNHSNWPWKSTRAWAEG